MARILKAIAALIILVVLCSGCTRVKAQMMPEPKREFRGVWLATVDHIDWPGRTQKAADQQKQSLIDIIEAHHQTGINAIFFQIRPAADAFYLKSREPWSQWLTGVQGQAPYPSFDPLEVAITEAHKRGIELHAWFNPYRATFYANDNNLSPTHITKTKPEWFLTYDGRKLFNPGLPEVRQYIVQVVLDVVDNYDIDGVHMDDYFYPYRVAGQKINDAQAFADHPNGFTNIDDWRRNNVDLLIKMLGDSIHKHKPYVKFGISPFGIWKNKSQDIEGSETAGGNSYYELYADSRKWVKQGWVDYINPQVYWYFGFKPAAFDKLVNWWAANSFNRHLYIGLAPYRMAESRPSGFKLSSQLPDQMKFLRYTANVQGCVFFSSTSITDNLRGFTDSLKNTYFKYLALPPDMPWLSKQAPGAPQQLQTATIANGITLKWQPNTAPGSLAPYGYVVYRTEGAAQELDTSKPRNILAIKYSAETTFTDLTAIHGKTYQYVVTAISRLKAESPASNASTITLK